MTDIDNAQTLLAAGAASAEVEEFAADGEGLPDVLAAVVPAGYQLATVDVAAKLNAYRDAPRRVTGTATLTDTASWLAYVGKHGGDWSEVYGDVEASTVTAVLNAPPRADDADGQFLLPTVPAWGDHRAVLALKHSAAWLAWTAKDGALLTQTGFAEHVEDRSPDFVTPDAATMLELAQTFAQTTGVKFESSQRLSDGQTRFQYMETTEAKAGTRGEIKVPSKFEIRLQPWRGVGIIVPLTARLRSRASAEGLRLGYVLDRLDDVLDAAWSALLGELTETLPVPVLAGTAPSYAGRC